MEELTISQECKTTTTMSTKSTYKNLLVLGFTILCVYGSFKSLQNLQSSVHENEKIGLASLSVLYASCCISCLFLPPILIKKLGCKYSIVLSTLGFSVYAAAHLYPTWWIFITASAIIGSSSAPLWCASVSYVTTLAMNYASAMTQDEDATITKFFGIFFMLYQLSQVSGNLLSSVILKQTSASINSINQSYVCGAEHCPGLPIVSSNQKTEHSTVVMLIITYLVLGGVATMSSLLFLENIKMVGKNTERSFKEIIIKTFQSFKDWRFLFLMPFAAYTGLESGFVFAEFNKAYVTCAVGIQKVGFIMIAFGMSNAISSYIVGSITKLLGRPVVIMCAMVFNIGLVIWHHIWEPLSSSLFVFFLTAAAWGISDSVWQTEITAYYGCLFHSDKEILFSLQKLVQSLGFMVGFAYGDYLCVSNKLHIQVCLLIISVILYGAVAYNDRKNKKKNPSTSNVFPSEYSHVHGDPS